MGNVLVSRGRELSLELTLLPSLRVLFSGTTAQARGPKGKSLAGQPEQKKKSTKVRRGNRRGPKETLGGEKQSVRFDGWG